MKILFVIPKTKSMFGGKNIPDHPHVGIAYLTAWLKKHHYQVSVFDDGISLDDNDLDQVISLEKPDIVGITIFSYCYQQAYSLIDKIKSHYSAPVIVGGPHVSATKSLILKETKADFALIGEGELSLLEFLNNFSGGKKTYSKVPGLIWRQGKKILENTQGELIKNLSILPFPDYSAFKFEKYPCFKNKTLPLLTSRGCPYGCSYCSVRLSMGRGFRARSPQNVLSEIELWYKRGFNNFDINDDCFTLDIDRAKKICDGLIKKKLKIHFQLYNGIRVDRVDLELLRKLKKAGCTFIAYGCEAGNERILKLIHKSITLSQVRKAVDLTNKVGIKNAVNFIIGHSEETYKDAEESLSFASSLPTNFVNFYNLVPYPGTEAYDWAIKNANFLYPKDKYLKEISYRDNVPIYETEQFTKKEREDIMRRGFALYEKKVLQFRLGKTLGIIVYYLTRFEFVHRYSLKLLFDNQIVRKLFVLISSRSRE